jgi:hypothetical protein
VAREIRVAASAITERLRRVLVRPETAVFVGLLAVYAATTNTRGLYHASLHQGVVKALVEQGTLYLRDYDPREPLGGDVFIHDGHVYANKQPGSFVLGAAVYWVVRLFGVTYDRDFYLTAALVGVFTSGLLTALTALAVYRMARERASPTWAAGAALAFGLGSSALPYAGSLHHDVVATACLAFAWIARRWALLAGAFLGLALTCSLLPAAMVVAMAVVHAIAPLGNAATGAPFRETSSLSPLFRRSMRIAGGIAIGVAPLLLANWLSFGAPWRMPLLTGGMWPESSPRFDPPRATGLLVMYARLLLWYAPIMLVGWAGLIRGAIRRAGERGAAHADALENRRLLAIVAAQLVFVISLGTDGACQYGPRLLLPTMPFACLGLLTFAGRSWSRAAAGALVAVGVVSFVINLVGALYGTMFCDVTHSAFLHYADAIRHRVFFSFPLLGIEGQAPY